MKKLRCVSLAIALTALWLSMPIPFVARAQDAAPTLAADPQVYLQIADRYLLHGYYENAVAAYQTLLAAGNVAPDMRAGAVLGLGQAALREGLFADAVSALTDFLDQYPNDSRAGWARFLRGDAYLGLSEWQSAITDFENYLVIRPGLIDSYAHERIGDALIALGDSNGAVARYRAAADASRSSIPLAGLRERLAQVYLSAGQYPEAVAQYDAILTFAENPAYRAGIELGAALAQIDGGDSQSGLQRVAKVFNEYPETPSGYAAMGTLIAAGIAVDDWARGGVAFAYGDYNEAVDALLDFSTSTPIADIPAELHMLLGRAYREIGNTAAALTAFQTVRDQYTTDPLFGEALLEQGRTYFQSGDVPAAIEHYLNVATTYNYLPEAAEALWRAGYLYTTNDNPAEARRIFERLADEYPDSTQSVDGLMLAASIAFTAGDRAGAERFYAEVARKATLGEDRANAYMQVGRLALERGDNATATTAFQGATSSAPDTYYGARARDIIGNVAPFARPATFNFTFDDAAEVGAAETWLRATFGITQEGALWQLSPTLADDARLIRGTELWAVAAYDEARTEFDSLLTQYETDGLASYQLAIYFRGLTAYQDSIVAAANVIRTANVGTLDAPPYIARMRYPAYYLDSILESSERQGIDPLLLLSLIRHESLFDTFATAAAGEKGLTQVIPGTGEYIAQQLQFPDYQHSDLFKPYAGIEFGAYYLGENLGRFDGNVTASLSGYNAGPGRAITWLEIAGADHDLFLNAISIDSTRTYVQRIYGYYNIYRSLYGL